MPPRLDLLTKRWSILDLPVLPFLAPRVFQPWPQGGRRVYSAATQAGQQKVEDERIICERPLQGRGGRELWSPTLTEEKSDLEFPQLNHYSSHVANNDHNRLSGALFAKGEPTGRTLLDKKSPGTLELDDFSKMYEDIWGSTPEQVALEYGSFNNVYEENMRSAPKRARKISTRDSVPLRKRTRDAEESARKQLRADALAQMAARRRLLGAARQKEARRTKIPQVRPRWARYHVGIDSRFHSSFYPWNRQFAILNSRHEQFMKGRKLPDYGYPTAPKFPAPFILGLINHESSETLSLEWETFDARRRMEIWPELMLKALEYHPEKALKVMAATYNQQSVPPAYALSDCLNFIISYHFDENVPSRKHALPNKTLVEQIFKYVLRLLRSGPKDHLNISQHSIHLLLSNFPREIEMKELYALLTELDHPLHENTLIHFGYSFAKFGYADLAIQALQRLNKLQCDFNTPKILSLCSAILDAANLPSDTAGSDSDRLEYMLQCGMQPNIIHYNILLKNSLRRGDHSTAWQLHGMMIDSGLEPDAFTYSLLLRDSKQRMDPEAIRTVMEMVREKGIKSNYIVTDILHAISLLHRQRAETLDLVSEPRAAFRDMLKVYLENFSLAPLQTIIPWISEIIPQIQSSDTLPVQNELDHPPAPALALMIAAFLHEVQTPSGFKMFYGHFRELVSVGDPAVASLVGTTHIWDLVIMGFGKFQDGLRECPSVIGDMLSPVDVSTSTKESQPEDSLPTGSETLHHYTPLKVVERSKTETESWEGLNQPPASSLRNSGSTSLQPETVGDEPRRTPTPPKPSVWTWSILLNAFGRNRQTRAAERVLNMMQENGVRPSVVTWNSLLDSYARSQDTEMAVDVISRMQASGIETDEASMSILRKIRDRQGVVKAMKRSTAVVEPRAAFLSQLRDDLEEDMRDELVHGVRSLLKGVQAKASESRAAEIPSTTAADSLPQDGTPAQLHLKPVFSQRFVFKDLAKLPTKEMQQRDKNREFKKRPGSS